MTQEENLNGLPRQKLIEVLSNGNPAPVFEDEEA